MNAKASNVPQQQASVTADGKFDLLLFRLGEGAGSKNSEPFGINVFKVREIVVAPQITSIVNAPKFSVCLANIRGQLIPVIDLPALAGCKPLTNTGIVLVSRRIGDHSKMLVQQVLWAEVARVHATDSDGESFPNVTVALNVYSIFGEKSVSFDTRSFKEAQEFVDTAVALRTPQ
jgi:chemotaxis signal transduction protein